MMDCGGGDDDDSLGVCVEELVTWPDEQLM